MYKFKLKELNFSRCRNWLLDGARRQTEDPVYSFIATWISFNHFYTTYAYSNLDKFRSWSNEKSDGNLMDKAQWNYLIDSKEFVQFFKEFEDRQKILFEIKVGLPIKNILFEKNIPEGYSGECKLSDLGISPLIQAIYQIRNNLFHGIKDPFQDKRDRRLSQIGCKFMLPLVCDLLIVTEGEVLDALDDIQHEEIGSIRKIAGYKVKNESEWSGK